MIRSIEIHGLFGNEQDVFMIEFKKDLTILVGENGSGKTTVLNIINMIINKSFNRIFKYNFSKINFKSDEGDIRIIRNKDNITIKRIDVERAIKQQYGDKYLSAEVIKKLAYDLSKDDPLVVTKFDSIAVEEKFMDVINSLYLVIMDKEVDAGNLSEACGNFLYNKESIYFPTYRRIEMDFQELFIERIKETPIWSPRMKWMLNDHGNVLFEKYNNTIVGLSNKDINEIILKKWSDFNIKERSRLGELIEQFFYSLLEPFSGKNQGKMADILKFNSEGVRDQLMEIFRKTGLVGKIDKLWIQRIDEYIDNLKMYARYFRNQKALNNIDIYMERNLDEIVSEIAHTIKYGKSKCETENIKDDLTFSAEVTLTIDEIDEIDFSNMEVEEIINVINKTVSPKNIMESCKEQIVNQLKKEIKTIGTQLPNYDQFRGKSEKSFHLYGAVQAFALHEKINRIIDLYKDSCSLIEKDREPFKILIEMLSDFMGKSVDIRNGEIKFKHKNKKMKDDLSFEQLSAGEKQLVTMFVYAKLALKNDSLIIIDEPELSLHVKWQRKFLPAITKGNSNMQYIISTHSPFVISSFKENIVVVGPYEPEEDEKYV